MPAPRHFRKMLLLSAASLLVGGRAAAQLAASSPFLPAASSGTAAVTEGAPIELRGLMETRSGMSFCIFDPAKKASTWARLGEKGYDFVIKSFDAANETVVVDHGGRTLTLAMRAVKVASSGQASAPPPLPAPGQQPAMAPAVTQSVVLNPTPADEQRRLEAVATEVRRRRAMREQASIQAATGQPVVEAPAPAVQPAQPLQAQPQNQNQTRRRQRN